jgi:hypothetical protein
MSEWKTQHEGVDLNLHCVAQALSLWPFVAGFILPAPAIS